jgi:hypothetical protein
VSLRIGSQLDAGITLDRLRPEVLEEGSVTEPPRTVTAWPLDELCTPSLYVGAVNPVATQLTPCR